MSLTRDSNIRGLSEPGGGCRTPASTPAPEAGVTSVTGTMGVPTSPTRLQRGTNDYVLQRPKV